jgi:hypothetical protein
MHIVRFKQLQSGNDSATSLLEFFRATFSFREPGSTQMLKCLRLLCGASGYPPNVLQPTEAYCTNPALVSPFHPQRRSTSTGVRYLYQRKMELWGEVCPIKFSRTVATSTVIVGFFYMPQSCDMGPTALLPLRKKAC